MSGAANILCCEPFEPLPERCNGTGPPLNERSYLFTLDSQGFSGHPGALVYIPQSFDDKAKEIVRFIYFLGIDYTKRCSNGLLDVFCLRRNWLFTFTATTIVSVTLYAALQKHAIVLQEQIFEKGTI